jgi:chaperone modulatory protein CbpM
MSAHIYTITEVCTITGLNETVLHTFIEREWIRPVRIQTFDHEDVARLQLILDLERTMAVNEDAIPIILHLIDQLHYLRGRLKSGSIPE